MKFLNELSSNRNIKLVRLLFKHISRHRRLQFFGLLILTLLSSVAEVVSLGAVIPFIGILTQPERVFKSHLIARFIHEFGITSPQGLVLPLTVAFVVAAVIAGVLRVVMLWTSIRLGNATGADLSIEVYRRTLYQPYSVHMASSSSKIISGITQKVESATNSLTCLITVVTSIFLFIAIVITLIAIDPLVASIALLSFGVSYIVIAWKTRCQLVSNSQSIALQQTQRVKILQEGLGAIRDVLLDGSQSVYCGIYQNSIQKLQLAISENSYIAQVPRYAMESLGMILIGVFAYSMSFRQGGVGAAFPILGALALGAQRLLPLLQQIYGNSIFIIGSQASMEDVVELLEQPLPEDANLPVPSPLTFHEAIRFENVSFRYNDNRPWVFQNINLTIPKSAKIGFVGSTGSGKSTVVDLMISLLEPTQGRILIDGRQVSGEYRRAWQRNIAHVPQSIYLADATIAENIAFGVPKDKIDLDQVRRAAKQANIAEFIESNPEGYNAFVGERGIWLSGGQRQRIGIARALYKQAKVLIFDEATSSLDSETERGVMEAIKGLGEDLTIIIIAHRLSTLENCDQIIEFGQGRILRTGGYQSLIQQPRSTREAQQ